MAHDVTDRTFDQEVLNAATPVVVDFWAVWCGPCQLISPIVEELSQQYQGRVEFVKLNVDENPETSMKYGIRSIPTLLVFKDGKPVDQVVGAVQKRVLQSRVDKALD